MKIKIGVISPKKSMEYIKKVEKYIPEECEIVYLTYSKLSDLKNIYFSNQMFFDGIIFSGELSYQIILNEIGETEKPIDYIHITKEDFYKFLFQILINNRDIDFSRVYIDFIFESNGYLGLKDIIDKKNFPYVLNPEIKENIYDVIFEKHLTLWRDRKIDFSITRVSNIVDKLNDHGMKNIFIFPSQESIINTFEKVIREIKLIRLESNLVAVANITIDDLDLSIQSMNSNSELQHMLLHKALIEYSNKYNVSFIIQKNNIGFEVFTSNGELRELTKDFTYCSLLDYLKKSLSFTISIGWGIGVTIYQGRSNAQNANREANNNGGDCSFIIKEDEVVIGPLNDKGCLEYSNSQDPQIEEISSKLNLSSLNVQKIMAVMKKLNTNELTADDLAFHLGITLRSSNRILSKLVEKGAAEVAHLKQEKLRGRPKKVYMIDFQKR